MDLTITLPNELARKLANQAKALNQSLDEVAASLLSNVLKQLPSVEGDADLWAAQNMRRLQLIQKTMDQELDPDQKAELERLQSELYRRLEESDDQFLSELEKMGSELEAL